ncbi:MAG: hypothetical protein JWM47_2404 [Acidimicrobiales bacterium]|nr:hypothetical protein [Acidimicrobiales bacterium]
MSLEATVEHRYPEAWAFLREHGAVAVAVLHAVATGAHVDDGELVVQVSTREVAGRLGFLSKDSAHRQLRALRRAGVLEPVTDAPSAFTSPTYRLHLDGTGITVTRPALPGH